MGRDRFERHSRERGHGDEHGRLGRTDFADDLLRISKEVEEARNAAKLEKRRLRKRQTCGALPVSGLKDGRIRIGSRWVDPEPVQGVPLEVRPENGAKWFSTKGSPGSHR